MKSNQALLLAALFLGAALSGCSSDDGFAASSLEGQLPIDGSSTVYPITEAVAEEFRKVHSKVRVEVGISGTGGGFKKFCAGSTVINDASRPIKQKEIDLAKKNGVGFIELPVAYDGLTVVIHKDNSFVDHLTIAELKKIWNPDSLVANWKEVRAGFPDLPIKLYGPGTDSGTFDYFTKAVNGKEGACRADFTASEDDSVLVKGVAGDKGGLGFFGYAYYVNNKEQLRAVKIQKGDNAPVGPSLETINDGSYKPLSRPIFIYVAKQTAGREDVKTFVEFYLSQAPTLVEECGYVKLPEAIYTAAKARFAAGTTGSIFSQPDAEKRTLLQLYSN